MSSPARPAVREGLALMDGYHSPQLDVSVRLNTNESPAPPPDGWVEAVQATLAALDWHRYPDRTATGLREAIAAHEGVQPAQVFAANGSNEVLQCLLLAYGGSGRRACVFEPTYALHSHIARLTGTEVVQGERDADLALQPESAAQLVTEQRPAVTLLCSPNNPTGMIDPPGSVERLLAAAEAVSGLLVVDEAYGQFARRSATELLDETRPLAVTRTFSKTWSMAAARLGYLLGPSWLVQQLEKVALPYHLDAIKQAAGRLALTYHEAMRARVAELVAERERLVAGLDELAVQQWPSEANFILFRPHSGDGEGVWKRLVEQSVLVRNCASWPRLAGCLRVTVGSPEENDVFLNALARALP